MKIGRISKFIGEELIYGCHLLCLGASAIVIASAILLNETIDWTYPFIIYLIAYLGYLYNRYKEINDDTLSNPERSCLLYTSPSPRDQRGSRMPSSA